MLIYPSTEDLLPRAGNRYILAMLASRRARQLTSGARPVIDSETRNRVSLASEEVHAGAVVFRYGKQAVVVPEDPVLIAAREAAEREARAKEEEERLEEQSRVTRRPEHDDGKNVFEAGGFSVADASLIAERFISHVEKMEQEERRADEQLVEEDAALTEQSGEDPIPETDTAFLSDVEESFPAEQTDEAAIEETDANSGDGPETVGASDGEEVTSVQN